MRPSKKSVVGVLKRAAFDPRNPIGTWAVTIDDDQGPDYYEKRAQEFIRDGLPTHAISLLAYAQALREHDAAPSAKV